MSTILLVDDNAPLREIMALVLRRAGHRVLEAGGGGEGFRRLDDEPVDVVVTDVLMPEPDGLEMLRRCREEHPALRVVVISGDSPRVAPLYLKVAETLGAHRVLLKPFSTAVLLDAVQDLTPATAETATVDGRR